MSLESHMKITYIIMNIHQIEHIFKGADPVFTIGAKVLLLEDKKNTGFKKLIVSLSFQILKMDFFQSQRQASLKYFLTCSESPMDD